MDTVMLAFCIMSLELLSVAPALNVYAWRRRETSANSATKGRASNRPERGVIIHLSRLKLQ